MWKGIDIHLEFIGILDGMMNGYILRTTSMKRRGRIGIGVGVGVGVMRIGGRTGGSCGRDANVDLMLQQFIMDQFSCCGGHILLSWIYIWI